MSTQRVFPVLVSSLIIISALIFPSFAGSSMYQRCRSGSDCILGEYVFDNQGIPVSNQICTIDIRNPAGSLIINNASMTAESDGWHHYTVNITSPTGLYRALMYCDNSGDDGYVDKSFYLGKSFEDISSDIEDTASTITGSESVDLTELSHMITGIQNTVDSIETKVDQFSEVETKIDTLITRWGSITANDLYDRVVGISVEMEQLTNAEGISPSSSLSDRDQNDIRTIKNAVLEMKALITINRNYLETISNKPVVETWLEEGSIIFKTLIANPSKIAEQDVAVDYYLPREIQRENIITLDTGLSADYDMDTETFRITGIFTLDPEESMILIVEAEDLWIINSEEITSLRRQADDLVTPLSGTSYYSQGALIKSDIHATLDNVLRLKEAATTPQTRILNYRKAEIELNAVRDKIGSLETLVVSAGSMNSMFGFIGGSQAVVAWGIVIAILGGFIILALYIRSLIQHRGNNTSDYVPDTLQTQNTLTHDANKRTVPSPIRIAVIAVISILATGSIIAIYWYITKHSSDSQINSTVEEETQDQDSSSINDYSNEMQITGEDQVLGAQFRSSIIIVVPSNTTVPVTEEPFEGSPIVYEITSTTQYQKQYETKNWIHILITSESEDNPIFGWVNKIHTVEVKERTQQ